MLVEPGTSLVNGLNYSHLLLLLTGGGEGFSVKVTLKEGSYFPTPSSRADGDKVKVLLSE